MMTPLVQSSGTYNSSNTAINRGIVLGHSIVLRSD